VKDPLETALLALSLIAPARKSTSC